MSLAKRPIRFSDLIYNHILASVLRHLPVNLFSVLPVLKRKSPKINITVSKTVSIIRSAVNTFFFIFPPYQL